MSALRSAVKAMRPALRVARSGNAVTLATAPRARHDDVQPRHMDGNQRLSGLDHAMQPDLDAQGRQQRAGPLLDLRFAMRRRGGRRKLPHGQLSTTQHDADSRGPQTGDGPYHAVAPIDFE